MNTTTPDNHSHRRKRHYIDRNVQGRLLVAMVLLEVLLFGGALYFVYLEMAATIDANLYRVHVVQESGLPPLLKTVLLAIGWMVAINIAALIIADRIWSRHIQSIIHSLRNLLSNARALDFRRPAQHKGPQHEVLDIAQRWLHLEGARHQQLHVEIEGLDATQPEQARASLERLRQLLQ